MDKKIHILLVDEDEINRRFFGSKLASAGFEVLYGKDGNEGREIARRFQPDLILMDINMPVMDGIKTSSLLKEEKETSNIPIIFLTNVDLSIEEEKAVKELGVLGCIPKSIEAEEFIKIVKKALSNHADN